MENEVRLIDANALKKAMRMWPRTKQPVLIYTGTILKGINDAPTIDPESLRPKGRWIETYSYGCWHYDCSNCDDGYATNEQDQRKPNYCHNCGADMRKQGK